MNVWAVRRRTNFGVEECGGEDLRDGGSLRWKSKMLFMSRWTSPHPKNRTRSSRKCSGKGIFEPLLFLYSASFVLAWVSKLIYALVAEYRRLIWGLKNRPEVRRKIR